MLTRAHDLKAKLGEMPGIPADALLISKPLLTPPWLLELSADVMRWLRSNVPGEWCIRHFIHYEHKITEWQTPCILRSDWKFISFDNEESEMVFIMRWVQ